MFSGVVQAIGRVRRLGRGAGGVVLVVEARDFPVDEIASGESVAVDGVCLTVTATSGATFSADVVPETLSRTTLGAARPGTRVNLERSLRLGDLVSGHLLQGHVDATYWLDLGKPEAFVQGSADLVRGVAPSAAVAQPGDFLVLEGSSVHEGATVRGGSTVGSSQSPSGVPPTQFFRTHGTIRHPSSVRTASCTLSLAMSL